jgi:3-methylcrotonyl-CoA carboxylase alpha subunit
MMSSPGVEIAIRRLLIANRGEIAVRIARTARRLGLRTVAVYSDADRGAAHVRCCDEAVHIGASAASDSYLRIEALLEAARITAADAIHPGYGFLSESGDFAEACVQAGRIFVGPPAAVIRALGSKASARSLARSAGARVVEGYDGEEQSVATLRREADRLGYPLLIKPVAGGGGKGMHRVDTAAAFESALATARREARASFADERVLLERFISPARHIEVQLLADAHGHCVHLFDRDCSSQRRRQKLLEEAPAWALPLDSRAALHATAIRLAQAAGYVNAGTAEFLLGPDGAWYFLEMNTRLQVEHGVTELICGLDLVEWQLRIAAGEALPFAQKAIVSHGHAMEVRLCAEDSARDFLPAVGRIEQWVMPQGDGVRVDAGMRAGDEVTPFYDSLLAKVMVHAATRVEALMLLRRALRDCWITGVETNRALLAALADTAELRDAGVDIDFIERERVRLSAAAPVTRDVYFAGAAALLCSRAATRQRSPWEQSHPWRLNAPPVELLALDAGDGACTLRVEYVPAAHGQQRRYRMTLEGRTSDVAVLSASAASMEIEIDGHARRMSAAPAGEDWRLRLDGADFSVRHVDPLRRERVAETLEHGLRAPMPGRVIAVHVKPGMRVERGLPLLVIEAMKMEHTLSAPTAGEIKAVRCAVGEQVAAGAQLLEFVVSDIQP